MKLVLCVSGGIAASLIPGWVLYLRQIRDWDVQVLLTENATRFVTPTALASLSNNPVYIGNRWMDDAGPIHKEIAQTADVVAVSPCTLNTFAKLSTGLADDAVTLTAAFATCPVVLFPAFSPSEIRRLWKKMHDDVVDAGYFVSESQVPAQRVSDGETTGAQGFPTIDIFEREILRAVGQHAAA